MKPFALEQAKKAAETVAKKHGLSFVALFGSQATGNKLSPNWSRRDFMTD